MTRAGGKTARRRRLTREQNGRCYYCNVTVTAAHKHEDSSATIEHLIPRCLGGGREPGNEVMACRWCNQLMALVDAWAFHTFGASA